MHIHFVCTGNSYRSRLAEAYCRSIIQGRKDITVSSSGIETEIYRLNNGPICWYAMKLIKRQQLIPFMSWQEQQSTKDLLKNVDLLICMRQTHLDYCQNILGYNRLFEVWDIPDLDEMDGFIPSTTLDANVDANHIKLTEQTYQTITQKVDNLITRLKVYQSLF
jgi:protein-tyrosine-phosphatase